MSNAIQVNSSQHAIYTGDQADVQWQADQGKSISGNDYGMIQSVTSTEGGDYVVKTDKGTLTFNASSPHLQEAKRDFANFELVSTVFPEFEGINWFEMAQLIMDAEKIRRDTNREVRLNARETAFNEAMTAAKTLRDAAKKALTLGIVSGAVSIAGGALGVIGGVSNLSKACKACKVKTGRTAIEADLATNTQALAKNKAQLKTLNAKQNKTPADLAKIEELQVQQGQLQKNITKLNGELDLKLDAAKKKEAKAQTKHDQQKTEVDELKTKLDATKRRRESLEDLDALDPDGAAELKQVKADEARLESALNKKTSSLEKSASKLAAAKASVADLQSLKTRSARMQDAETDQELAELDEWQQSAKNAHDKQLQEVQDLQTQVQAWTPLLNATQGTFGGISQGLNAGSQAVETNAQADNKERDANIANANFAQEDANAELQDSYRAVQQFQATWEKYLDTAKATDDRMVQA